jgi:hypothetical protein
VVLNESDSAKLISKKIACLLLQERDVRLRLDCDEIFISLISRINLAALHVQFGSFATIRDFMSCLFCPLWVDAVEKGLALIGEQ